MSLEDFLAGKPLSERMAQLMRGEDEVDGVAEAPPHPKTFADGTPVTDQEREHLRRMMAGAGWQVLLKLLDTELQHGEDTARRISVQAGTAKEEILTAWSELAADQRARRKIEALAEAEVGKLKSGKKLQASRHDMATARGASDQVVAGNG
jgi:hypothetical protein